MPEASYDEASRARYRARASRPGGSGPGGFDSGTRMIFIILMAVFAVVAGRLVWLQVVDSASLSEDAEQHRTNAITLHAKRGTIYDRNGNVLAMSVDCKTIYCNPKEITDPLEWHASSPQTLAAPRATTPRRLPQNRPSPM